MDTKTNDDIINDFINDPELTEEDIKKINEGAKAYEAEMAKIRQITKDFMKHSRAEEKRMQQSDEDYRRYMDAVWKRLKEIKS
ncbi:MAG: hypothetical protein CMI55_03070 [Parcubacteria group bacterium]|jgi:ribosome recycling factor|nr:hypothetical protein [Parcubacteria group bacterium]|tara:strand:- start:21 stop:269 length:249 start_codon:yes stop_codon:yes gene_type:complete